MGLRRIIYPSHPLEIKEGKAITEGPPFGGQEVITIQIPFKGHGTKESQSFPDQKLSLWRLEDLERAINGVSNFIQEILRLIEEVQVFMAEGIFLYIRQEGLGYLTTLQVFEDPLDHIVSIPASFFDTVRGNRSPH